MENKERLSNILIRIFIRIFYPSLSQIQNPNPRFKNVDFKYRQKVSYFNVFPKLSLVDMGDNYHKTGSGPAHLYEQSEYDIEN